MAGQAPYGFSHVQQPGGFSPAVISAGPQLNTAGGDGKGTDGSQQSVWTEHVNETGRKYYFNTVTKQSSWEKPDDLRTPAELMLTRCPWREYTSDSGKTYYHNVDTKESKWTIPDELRELREKVERGDGGPVEFNYPSSIAVKTEPEGKSALDQAMAATLAAIELPDGVQAAQPALPTAAPKEEVETSSESEEEEKPRDDVPEKKFKDKKQAIEAFKELLRDREVPSAVSFEAACKMIQDDYRFNALTRQNERKQAFNAYKIQKAKDEREEQRLKVKKAREDLEQFFLTTPEMHSTLKYFRCEERFGELDVWKNVPDETRRDLYADAIFTLSKREKELAKALRKKNMKTFAEVLDSMVDITYKTSWQTAQLALTESPKFVGDPELMAMDKEDALIVFEDHIRRLEQEEQDEREREKKHQRRIQRKVRDNFLLLLDDLHEQGKLTSMSLWVELFPEFSSDERFLAMLGQPGSTPLDLFKFYVEELKSRFHDEKKLIKDIVKSADFEVVADTTFEEFAMVICNDKRSATLDAGNVKLTYNAMIEKAESREKERQKEEARKAKKQEVAFKEMLKKENIEELILWEDARPKVESAEEFAAITLESERLRLFKEYQTALVELKQKAKKKKKEKTRKKSKSRSRSRSRSLSPISDSDSEFDSKAKSSSKSKKRRSRSKSRSRGRRSDSYSSISSGSDLDRRSKRGKKKRKKKKKDDSDSEGGSRRKKSSKRRRSRSRTPPRKSRKGGRREHDQEDGEISDTSKH